jgi:hypothetical protein
LEKNVDERAVLLIEELATHPKDQGLDFDRWRKRFQGVFAEPIDERSRVVLLDAYKAFLDLMERGLEESGGDVEGFQNAREADWRALCLQEAQLITGSKHFHPAVFGAIVERELAAGRIQDSEFTRLAAHGTGVFGKKVSEKRGWLSRLFRT